MQKEELNKDLYKVVDIIPSAVLKRKNKAKTFEYGYNEKYDVVVISRDGTVGDVISINNINIGLPSTPSDVFKRSPKKEDQYWEVYKYPKQLKQIKSIFQWNESPKEFKSKWVDYVESEFDRRESGYWFYNNGTPTYITGTHYIYLQ